MTELGEVATLRERCEYYRGVFAGDGTATDADLLPYWPGGQENESPADGLSGWIVAYGRCLWCLGRAVGHEAERNSEAGQAKVDAVLTAALRGAPETVELTLLDQDDRPQLVQVYPKSFEALAFCDALDGSLGNLTAALAFAETLPPEESIPLRDRVLEAIALLQRQLCWAFTHPGPRLPFDSFGAPPEPPDWTRDLGPIDHLRILKGAKVVNRYRLAVLSQQLGRGDATGVPRPSWATLAATGAGELHVGTQTLLRDWSLESWIAQLQLAAEARRVAFEAAKNAGKAA